LCPLPSPGCGPESSGSTGCVLGVTERSTRALNTAAGCQTRVEVMISYPVAFMPLAATVRDPEGAAVATTTPCHDPHSGVADACLDFAASASSGYTIEVAAAAGADTCGGACDYNRYTMAVQVLKP
jgi:hypothetical protein